MQAHGRQVRIARQQLGDGFRERIQDTEPALARSGRRAGAAVLVLGQHPRHALAANAQLAGDAAVRGASIRQANYLVARDFVHHLSNSLTRSWLKAATAPASRANHWKRGDRTSRSWGVSPVRPRWTSHTCMRLRRSSNIPSRFPTWFPASLS